MNKVNGQNGVGHTEAAMTMSKKHREAVDILTGAMAAIVWCVDENGTERRLEFVDKEWGGVETDLLRLASDAAGFAANVVKNMFDIDLED